MDTPKGKSWGAIETSGTSREPSKTIWSARATDMVTRRMGYDAERMAQ